MSFADSKPLLVIMKHKLKSFDFCVLDALVELSKNTSLPHASLLSCFWVSPKQENTNAVETFHNLYSESSIETICIDQHNRNVVYTTKSKNSINEYP